MSYSLNSLKGVYWGYIGILEKKMETTIWGLGFRVYGLNSLKGDYVREYIGDYYIGY